MKNVPNILSAIRILLAPVFLYLYWQESLLLGILGLVIFTIAALTDFLDGHLARKHEIETSLGIFLDPLADKVLTFSAFFVLPFISTDLFPWWAIGVIVFRDVFITIFRIFAESKNTTMETRKSAKVKTAVQLTFLYIGLLVGVFKGHDNMIGSLADSILDTQIMYILTMFVTAFTAYTGLEYVVVNRQLFSKNNA